jgi:hypothetical protein
VYDHIFACAGGNYRLTIGYLKYAPMVTVCHVLQHKLQSNLIAGRAGADASSKMFENRQRTYGPLIKRENRPFFKKLAIATVSPNWLQSH